MGGDDDLDISQPEGLHSMDCLRTPSLHHTYLEHGRLLAGGQVPHPSRLIHTASGQLPPVGAEGDAGDSIGVALSGERNGFILNKLERGLYNEWPLLPPEAVKPQGNTNSIYAGELELRHGAPLTLKYNPHTLHLQ